MALSEAEAELGRLDGQAESLPNPGLLMASFLRREAVLSSRIEGTQTTYSELVLFEVAEEELKTADAREVNNYSQALKYAVRRLADVSFSRSLIFETHRVLLTGTSAPNGHIGRLRDRQVYIASPGAAIEAARYVPPPAHEVEALFDNLITYLNSAEYFPLLLRLAITHYQIEAIHPFFDGNGRLGRLLIVLMLCHKRRLRVPMLYLSAYFERNRQQYNDLMLDVSRKGAWGPWIEFFLKGIAIQSTDTIGRTRELIALRERYRQRLSGARQPTAALTLVDALFRLPVLTNALAMGALSYTWQAANENVQKLVDAGILTKMDVPSRQQYFVAQEIIEILDRAATVATGPSRDQPVVVTQEI